MSHTYWTNKQTVESPLFDDAGKIVTYSGEVSQGPIQRALKSNPLQLDWIIVNHKVTAVLSLNDFGLITITRPVQSLSSDGTLDEGCADSDRFPTVLTITIPGRAPQIAPLRGRLMVRRRPDGTLEFGEVAVTKEVRRVSEPASLARL